MLFGVALFCVVWLFCLPACVSVSGLFWRVRCCRVLFCLAVCVDGLRVCLFVVCRAGLVCVVLLLFALIACLCGLVCVLCWFELLCFAWLFVCCPLLRLCLYGCVVLICVDLIHPSCSYVMRARLVGCLLVCVVLF